MYNTYQLYNLIMKKLVALAIPLSLILIVSVGFGQRFAYAQTETNSSGLDSGETQVLEQGSSSNQQDNQVIQNSTDSGSGLNASQSASPQTIESTAIPEALANKTPATPRTGVVLNIIIFVAAAVSIVLPIAFERHRTSKRNRVSSR
jgi:hypothetical protein